MAYVTHALSPILDLLGTSVESVRCLGSGRLARFTRSAHGGSHPHLVDAFVRAVVDGRPPRIDAPIAAAWTAPGLIAHESALRGGEALPVPDFYRQRVPTDT